MCLSSAAGTARWTGHWRSKRETATGELVELDYSRVVAALGFTADLCPLAGWGLPVVNRNHVGGPDATPPATF